MIEFHELCLNHAYSNHVFTSPGLRNKILIGSSPQRRGTVVESRRMQITKVAEGTAGPTALYHVKRVSWMNRAAPPVRFPRTCHFCTCRARRGNSQRLAKSSPHAGPFAGAEVARLRKWHVWCLLGEWIPQPGKPGNRPNPLNASRVRCVCYAWMCR